MNNLCCLCLTESNNITIIDDEDHEICHQIQSCLQLRIQFNGVKAGKICNDCLAQLTAAHGFFQKIHKAQLSENIKVQLKLLPCEQEPTPLQICDEKRTLNNNCLETLEDAELGIKDEPMEDQNIANESREYKYEPNEVKEEEEEAFSDDTSSEEERKTPNALANIKNWKTYPWYCYLCIYSTMNFSTLMAHMMQKHDIKSSKKVQYQCVDCTKKLNNYASFLNHVRVEHQPGLKLCCDVCSEHFSSYMKLGEHRREHTENSDIQQPLIFHCNHCSKVYPSRMTINKHVLTHDQGLECQMCDKSFKRLKYLKRHMEMHAELKHKCDFCDKTFHRRFNKINHERTHTGNRPYKCEHCEKTFSFQSTLKSHERIHTGEQPYKCEQCSVKFRHYDSLKEHMRKHTKESPFSCSECDVTFRYRKSLNRHMRLHTVKKEVRPEEHSKATKVTKAPKTPKPTKTPKTIKATKNKKTTTSAAKLKKTTKTTRKTKTSKVT